MVCIATFYSHFGAMRFKKECDRRGILGKLMPGLFARAMPVPRNLSSSCGTCVRYEGDTACPTEGWPEEMEQAVAVTGAGYQILWRAEHS